MRAIPAPSERDLARFLAKVAPTNENGCQLWTASLYGNGYGQFGLGGSRARGGGTYLTHRVAYAWFVGPIPEGAEIDHFTCYNHACVTPTHLRPATRKQNGENRSGVRVGAESNVRGVTKHVTKAGRVWWKARVTHNYREHSFGYYDTIAEAEAAAIAGRLELFTCNESDRVNS